MDKKYSPFERPACGYQKISENDMKILRASEKKSLAVIQPKDIVTGLRCPTYLERLLLGINCIGFCDGNIPEQLEHCKTICGVELFKRLGRYEMHKAPRLDNDNSIVIVEKAGENNG